MVKPSPVLYVLLLTLLSVTATQQTLVAMQRPPESVQRTPPQQIRTLLPDTPENDATPDTPGREKRTKYEESEIQKITNSLLAYTLTTLTMMYVVEKLLPDYHHPFEEHEILQRHAIRLVGALVKGSAVYFASALNRLISHYKQTDCNLFAAQIVSFASQCVILDADCQFPQKPLTGKSKCEIDPLSFSIRMLCAQILPIIYAHILNKATGQSPLFRWSTTCSRKVTRGIISSSRNLLGKL